MSGCPTYFLDAETKADKAILFESQGQAGYASQCAIYVIDHDAWTFIQCTGQNLFHIPFNNFDYILGPR